MVVIKWSDSIKRPRVKVDGTLCGGLYKEDHGSIITWSGTDPDANMNSFTWSTNENDWIIPGDQNHMKNLKLKNNPGRDVANCYNTILVNVESLDSAGAFKPEHLVYINSIFEDTSDSRFHIWATQKYKEVMEFVKKPLLCDEDVTQTDNTITYGLLVQESLREYSNIVNSKRWETTDIKKISKDESLLLTGSTAEIESPVNKTVATVYCKIGHKRKDNKYGVGS